MHFAFRFQKLFNLRRIKKLRPPAASLFLPLPRQQCREITRHFRPEKPVDPSGIAPAVASVVRRAAASVQTHAFLRLGSLLHLAAIPVVMLALALPMMTSTAQAQTAVTLAWDANPETNIAGYKVIRDLEWQLPANPECRQHDLDRALRPDSRNHLLLRASNL